MMHELNKKKLQIANNLQVQLFNTPNYSISCCTMIKIDFFFKKTNNLANEIETKEKLNFNI